MTLDKTSPPDITNQRTRSSWVRCQEIRLYVAFSSFLFALKSEKYFTKNHSSQLGTITNNITDRTQTITKTHTERNTRTVLMIPGTRLFLFKKVFHYRIIDNTVSSKFTLVVFLEIDGGFYF